MNIIDANNDSKFGSLAQGDVFKYHGETYIKTRPMDAAGIGVVNCINLETGDPGTSESDHLVQSHPTAELHLR